MMAIMLHLLTMSTSGSRALPLDDLVEDIIGTWQLRLPTIVGEEYMPELCMSHLNNLGMTQERVLCTTNAMDTNELADHLVIMHNHRKQDGIIFVGNTGQQNLLHLLAQIAPTLFTSDCPVFMPIEYAKDMHLRLDSNIVFYEERSASKYGITLDLGDWVKPNGFIFKRSINVWDRRTDLGGLTIIDGQNADGSTFWKFSQGLLFCIIQKVNMTTKPSELPHEPWDRLENGSWTGAIGILQRSEVDIVSNPIIGHTSERCLDIDCTMATLYDPFTLIAGKPKGHTLDIWAYVKVFKVVQWTIFFALLSSSVMMTLLFHTLGQESEQSKLNITLKSIETAYLFMIQLGDHANSKSGMRLLTLTIAMLTMVMFVHYTNDITAKMTSGPPKIPVRSFDDVIQHDYKVIIMSSYFKSILASAGKETAKYQVFKQYIENKRIRDSSNEAAAEIASEPKTLWYMNKLGTIPETDDIAIEGHFHEIVPLTMDDSGYVIAGFGLQRESEFSKMFNHYLLKESEHGIRNRLYRKYFNGLYVKEEFGMPEPQPLGIDNVMFTFCCLGVGVTISIITAVVEFMVRKLVQNQKPPSA